MRHHPASIMALATPSASVPGESTSAPEERGAGGLHCHAEWPQVADAVSAALRSSWPLSAPYDHACTRTNSTSCIPSPSVTNARNMLESCDNRVMREKRNGKMFRRHAEWPKMANCGDRRGDISTDNTRIILWGSAHTPSWPGEQEYLGGAPAGQLKPNAALHRHRGAVPRRLCPTPTALPGVRCKRLFGPPQRPAGHPPAGPARGPSRPAGAPTITLRRRDVATKVRPRTAGLGGPPSPPLCVRPRPGLRKTERWASGAANGRSDVGAEQLSWLSRGPCIFFSFAPPEFAKESDASAWR